MLSSAESFFMNSPLLYDGRRYVRHGPCGCARCTLRPELRDPEKATFRLRFTSPAPMAGWRGARHSAAAALGRSRTRRPLAATRPTIAPSAPSATVLLARPLQHVRHDFVEGASSVATARLNDIFGQRSDDPSLALFHALPLEMR